LYISNIQEIYLLQAHSQTFQSGRGWIHHRYIIAPRGSRKGLQASLLGSEWSPSRKHIFLHFKLENPIW